MRRRVAGWLRAAATRLDPPAPGTVWVRNTPSWAATYTTTTGGTSG
jgi:hypothetical protein